MTQSIDHTEMLKKRRMFGRKSWSSWTLVIRNSRHIFSGTKQQQGNFFFFHAFIRSKLLSLLLILRISSVPKTCVPIHARAVFSGL